MRCAWRWAVVSVVTAATVAACSADSATAPGASVTGMYDLRTVNGTGLPFTLQSDTGVKVTLVSDLLSMNADKSFTDVSIYRVTQGGGTVVDTSFQLGMYTNTSGAIVFNDFMDGITYTGTVSGGTLIEAAPGYTIVYRRR